MSNRQTYCAGVIPPQMVPPLIHFKSATAVSHVPVPGSPATIPFLPHVGAATDSHHALHLLPPRVLSCQSAVKMHCLPVPKYAFIPEDNYDTLNSTSSSTAFKEVSIQGQSLLPSRTFPGQRRQQILLSMYSREATSLVTDPVLDLSLKKKESCADEFSHRESISGSQSCSDIGSRHESKNIDVKSVPLSAVHHSRDTPLSASYSAKRQDIICRVDEADTNTMCQNILEGQLPLCNSKIDEKNFHCTRQGDKVLVHHEQPLCPKFDDSLQVPGETCHQVRSSDSDCSAYVCVKEELGEGAAVDDRKTPQGKAGQQHGLCHMTIKHLEDQKSHLTVVQNQNPHLCDHLSPCHPRQRELQHSPVGDGVNMSSGGHYNTDVASEGDPNGQTVDSASKAGKQKGTFKKDLMKRYCK